MKHNVYFDGKVQSLELSTPRGRATLGAIEPGAYQFSTASRERIVLVEGSVRVRLPGADWVTFQQGEQIVVGPGLSFDIDASVYVGYFCYYD